MPSLTPMTAADEAIVEAQLGRPVRGVAGVAWRCACGRPGVVATLPRLPDGTPFPTTYYLTDPRLVAGCSRLEAGGLMAELNARLAEDADYLIADTPGRDDPFARHIATTADTLVTPINDSFIDFDLIGQVDPETFQVTRPSFYSELIWDTRKARAKSDGRTIDWIILRNRLQHVDAHNMRRVGEALNQLSRRVGFRVIPGLGERVIYRELFPAGLTLLDKAHLGGMGIGHVVARQELREAMAGLNLPQRERLHPDGDLFAVA